MSSPETPLGRSERIAPRVLIVEDNHDVATFMDCFFADAGYETDIAHNGLEGLARMRRQRPSIVLLDLAMPVMDGFEFRRRQLEDPSLADVPVFCVTAHYNCHDVASSLGLRCFVKPLDPDQLEAEVAAICGR